MVAEDYYNLVCYDTMEGDPGYRCNGKGLQECQQRDQKCSGKWVKPLPLTPGYKSRGSTVMPIRFSFWMRESFRLAAKVEEGLGPKEQLGLFSKLCKGHHCAFPV